MESSSHKCFDEGTIWFSRFSWWVSGLTSVEKNSQVSWSLWSCLAPYHDSGRKFTQTFKTFFIKSCLSLETSMLYFLCGHRKRIFIAEYKLFSVILTPKYPFFTPFIITENCLGDKRNFVLGICDRKQYNLMSS